MAFRLTSLQDSVANKQDYLELGLNCADICGVLDRGMNGKRPDDFNQSVCKAISQLTMWVKAPCHSSSSVLTMRLIALELPRIFRRMRSRRAGAATFHDCSIRRMIRTRLLLGR